MTETEFKDFVRNLYGSFPGLREWVQKHSPDVAITHRGWFSTLHSCSFSECMNVLAGWLNGTVPIFQAYERDQIALVVRQVVFADRDKEAKRNKMLSIGEEYRKASRDQYRPLEADVPELRAAYAEFRQWDADTKLPINDPVRMAKIKEISAKLFPKEAR